MKRFLSILLASAAIGFAAVPSDAALIDRGGGLIYDNDLNITWLQDANYAQTSGYSATGAMTWSDAVAWAGNLVYGGYSDWRLPTVVPQNFNTGFDGTTGFGYNITTGSEMGHLFYSELGNLGLFDIIGTSRLAYGLANTGPFTNLQPGIYWSSQYEPMPFDAWVFEFNDGSQDELSKNNTFHALAVRDGDVAAASVPEPGTILLLGSGIAGLAAFRKRLGF